MTRSTFNCWPISSSADLTNFFCSDGSRANALTTLMPARFSCNSVFNFDRRICTCMNNGCAIVLKTMNRIIAIGRMGRIASVNCQLLIEMMIKRAHQQHHRLQRQQQTLAR